MVEVLPVVDYDFYTAVYLGSSVPEKAFPEMQARAGEALSRFRQIYRVTVAGAETEKLAICAMAEVLYSYRGRQGLRSASLGAVQVSYADNSKLNRELLQAAKIYLDIYRGTGI